MWACHMCGKEKYNIVPGSETDKMLECPSCHYYLYAIGNSICCGAVFVDMKTGKVHEVKNVPTPEEIRRAIGGH